MIRSHYEACKILNVKVGSGPDEWKSAYRNICKIYHPDNQEHMQMQGSNEMLLLAKEALTFLENEKVCVIGNTPQKPVSNATQKSKVVGSASTYKYNYDKYKSIQKKLNEKSRINKENKIIELKEANDKIRADEREKKEKEVLEKIRWIRLAQIIHDTIEKDKRAMNSGGDE